MQKIIIFGFPHSGTTILRSILGHCSNVYEVLYEVKKVDDRMFLKAALKGKKYVLIKHPYLIDYDEYNDYHKIFILRNPYYIFSSINKRSFESDEIRSYHSIESFDKTSTEFLNSREGNVPKLYHLLYEDMFLNNYSNIKTVLNKIGISYSDKIFDNSSYDNLHDPNSVSYDQVKEKSMLESHGEIRTWQINQPFKNMNNPGKLSNLTKEQIDEIADLKFVKVLDYQCN